jgi:chitinase
MLAVLLFSLLGSTIAGAAGINGKIIAAYVADYHFPNVNTLPAQKLTHIFYSFANVSNSSGIVSGGDKAKLSQLVSLKSKNKNLKISISIGGYGNSDNFSPASSTDAKRTAFANSVVKYIRDNKLDGVDVDWEYPQNNTDKANYTSLS